MTKHTIKTNIGSFTFGWADDKHSWIYGRFENPHKALKYFKCNRFSGKYNFRSLPIENLIIGLRVLKSVK